MAVVPIWVGSSSWSGAEPAPWMKGCLWVCSSLSLALGTLASRNCPDPCSEAALTPPDPVRQEARH